MKNKTKTSSVSEAKKKLLKELIALIEQSRTIMISSALNIPSSLFQKIRKNLRGNASMIVVKKNMGIMALEGSKKPGIKEMQKYVEASTAIIFSDSDPYELAAVLSEGKQRAFAKAGQIAPEDLIIEKGPTDLPPGPAISELSAVGLKVGVEGGKIAVKETKAIVKQGEAISKNAADILQKLDIKPFTIGILPIAAYDSNENKIFTNIIIDREGFLDRLKEAFSSSYNLAINQGYACRETIMSLLERAEREAIALNGLMNSRSQSPESPRGIN